MLRSNTDYEIEVLKNNIRVMKNDKIVTQGFSTVEGALQSVWVLEGRDTSEYYRLIGNKVVKENKKATQK